MGDQIQTEPETYARDCDTIADLHERLAALGCPASEVHRERSEHARELAREARDPRSLVGRWLRGDRPSAVPEVPCGSCGKLVASDDGMPRVCVNPDCWI
jgi:hypothetical protein